MKSHISFNFLIALGYLLSITFLCAAQQRSYKRGVSWQLNNLEDIVALSRGVSWYYNWAVTTASSDIIYLNHTDYVDFIPMAWNNGYNRTALRSFLAAHPNVKYILGFNEPNFKSQARMTPTEAANAWPEIEALADEFNLKIVGPAVNYAASNDAVTENGVTYTDPFKYLDDFFVACPGCRVDYIAVHCYMNDPSALSWYVNKFIDRYKKPVWLTEFCSWEAKAPLSTSKIDGINHQKEAMIRKVEYLELNPMVAKYAWFTNRTVPIDKFPYHQLMDINADNSAAKGILTELGKIYVNMSSFDSTKFYGVNDTIPAVNYMKSDRLKIESSTDSQSKLPIQLAGFEGGAFADYFIDIPTAGSYTVTVRMSNHSTFNPSFLIYLNGRYIDRKEVELTGGIENWSNRTFELNFEAGPQTLRLQSNGYTGNKIQWLRISESLTDLKQVSDSDLKLFVSPEKFLSINNNYDINKHKLYDMSGRIVLDWSNDNRKYVGSLKGGLYIYRGYTVSQEIVSRKINLNF
ncbi:MAG: glycosyl hydrolase [Lentimicrobium sp.]|jgi:hypothetical protein|nr:glycosyl hydrolase [Lentimicrobium sp.]